jgi:glyoxylase-like metal-dependent hydrolase (beta-lactamase superfamily II)
LVSGDDLKLASGFSGRLLGYLPHRWPNWFDPVPIAFEPRPFGPFDQSYPITQAGDVVIVPTPGHTPNHISVIVQSEDVNYFLAGDTSYNQQLLLAREPDGVSPRADVTRATIDRILALAAEQPTVYLPSHDPESAQRLAEKSVAGSAGTTSVSTVGKQPELATS